jgi:hypothetical protein
VQRDKYAKIELRPNKATRIDIIPEQIHPEYELKYQSSALATDTGHLELFRLEPSAGGLPAFSARWDLKPNTIDIDLIDDVAAQRAFKAGVDGYRGHHTVVVSDVPRVFQVDIVTPTGVVLVGKIEVEIELGLHLKETVNITGHMKDQFRILVECPYCGLVEVSGRDIAKMPFPQRV